MSNIVLKQVGSLASKLGMEDETAGELVSVLKATAFKGPVSDAQMTALLIVANQYNLNPWTKEIYAFPDKNNGIVPVVGVDGWARILNSHPQFDGMEFEQDDTSCTCIMYRKDRSRPVRVTEYKSECSRNTQPWQSHPKRMLRHKAMIQCARLAFGFSGFFDDDEADRIRDMGEAEVVSSRPAKSKQVTSELVLPIYSDEDLSKNKPAWQKAIDAGKMSPEGIIAKVSSKYDLTAEQRDEILAMQPAQPEQEEAQDDMSAHADFIAELDQE